MRVLLINPKSPESFWTFREVCKSLGRKALTQPLGLITMAALLPAEWELRLIDCNAREVTGADWDWAEMVMLSGMIVQRSSQFALIREAKARGKLVVTGGPYATSLPEQVLEAGSDFLVKGEGESSIPVLLDALKKGQTAGVIENTEKPNMHESPKPRFDLVNFDDYIALGVQTSRGCPFDCEFCDIVNLYGRKPRYKRPDQLIEELETIYRLGWKREVFITDDNFIGNKTHAKAILEKLTPWMKANGAPFSFWTQTSVDLGQDLDLIDRLTAANFNTVFLGLESPDEKVLTLNRKLQNIRNPLLESVGNINANGLSIVASFVIGFDGEQKGAGERICDFVDSAGIPMVALNILHALPNTRLWNRLKGEGRLLESKTTGNTSGSRPNFITSRPESEIVAEYLAAWDYLYEPSHYLERAYRFFLKMRPTRAAMGQPNPLADSVRHSAGPSLVQIAQDLYRFLRLVWKQGIRPRYRAQFWRQLVGIWWRNPSRFVKYLNDCGLGETLFPLRRVVRQGLQDVDGK
jgi:radical SAM superfamily enzyme YgiQ (UPF0313 family)